MAFSSTTDDGAHVYRTLCRWTGSTGAGYDGFDRTHEVSSAPAQITLTLANDPSLGGRADLLDPEQLLLAAASSCQLLSFLAVAARARIDVRGYRDAASATMSTDRHRARVAAIALHPEIIVAGTVSDARVEHLVEVAHRECYIANSLATPVTVVPVVLRED